MKSKDNLSVLTIVVVQNLMLSAQALQPEVLYEFPSPGPAFCEARLVVGQDENFYGTTAQGGTSGNGTVFKVTPNGNLTMLASFNGTNGSYPIGAMVVGRDGNCYGTTHSGGVNNSGTIYRVSMEGALTSLVSFNGTNGLRPKAGLVAGNDGIFYGTTTVGGNGSKGTVFRVTAAGELITLASFNGTNGAGPNGLTLGSDGSFYGTTTEGGSKDFGTVFKVTTNGVLTSLVSFNGTNGREVLGGALASGKDGNFYGTTWWGGSHEQGTVFRVTTNGALTTLASFNGTNGANPVAELTLGSDDSFYGSTYDGGSNNSGTVFKVSADGELTTLVSFSDPNGSGLDTYNGLVLGSDGNFYGTTKWSGSSRLGSVFKVTTDGEFTTLVSFSNPSGLAPISLVLANDGSFYGTTFSGGSEDYGTVFKLNTNGRFTTLASFTGVNNDANPSEDTGLLVGADDNIYGATQGDTVFKVSSAGQLTTLVSFPRTHGMQRVSSLVLGNDQAIYGTTTFEGYAYRYGGTVFSATPNGEVTTLVTFNGTNGAVPDTLVFGKDGNLYGTTAGESGKGVTNHIRTVFKLTIDGTLTTLGSYTWTNFIYGRTLILGRDGTFYGTNEGDDGQDHGTIFKMTTNGVLTTLISFNGTNGASPRAALISGNDGNFYGTTDTGGTADYGTVFKVTSDGVLTTLVSFNSVNGAYPIGSLVFGNDGNLYGTTASGGMGGGGTIFRVILPRLSNVVRAPGGSLLITGTGPAKDLFRLWGSTDVSRPFESWTLLTSGSFDSTGNFSFKDADAPTKKSGFYRLSIP